MLNVQTVFAVVAKLGVAGCGGGGSGGGNGGGESAVPATISAQSAAATVFHHQIIEK
jgi:hypothetical protein